MKHCPHCNQPVPRGTGTCPECGKPLKRTAPQPSEQPAAPFEIPQHLTANGKKTAAAIMVILAVITIIALAIFLTIMGDMIRRRSRYSNRQPRNGYVTTAPGSGDSGSTDTQSGAEITFLDSEVTKDVFRNDVLVVRIRYQNNEEKNMHFVQKYRIQVFQDGVSCQETMLASVRGACRIMPAWKRFSLSLTAYSPHTPEKRRVLAQHPSVLPSR